MSLPHNEKSFVSARIHLLVSDLKNSMFRRDGATLVEYRRLTARTDHDVGEGLYILTFTSANTLRA